MEDIKFFDWKLNSAQPVSYMKIDYRTHRSSHRLDLHSAIHLTLLYEGKWSGMVSGYRLEQTGFGVNVIAPWEPHMVIQAASDTKMLLFNIDCASLRNFFFTGREQLDFLLSLSPPERQKFLRGNLRLPVVGRELVELLTDNGGGKDLLLLWNTVLKFFIVALPEGPMIASETSFYQKLQPALKRLSGSILTVPEAARACNLSTSYFAAAFRRQFGVSFARYERNFRLNGAITAITRGATFKEAAEDWGFCDKSHLARLIKQYK